MKTLFFSLIFSLQLFAAPTDIHFKNSNQFIKIDQVQVELVPYTLFSACTKSKNGKRALCEDVALIQKSEFKKMRQCIVNQNRTSFAGKASGALLIFAPTTYGVTLVAGLALIAYSNYKDKEANELSSLFSEMNETDTDYVSSLRYDSLLEKLKESLEAQFLSCDVSKANLKIDHSLYTVDL